jgi:uncharacterized protein YecE (DUF72 family)
MDRPNADCLRLVPARGQHAGEKTAVLRPAVPAGGGRRHLLRAARRADRQGLGGTDPGRVHVQHQGVQPVHPAPDPVKALPADLREAASQAGKDRVYLKDVDPAVTDQAWDRFLAALEPLRGAGKLGSILLQFPPWFPISRANKDYILACASRAAPRRVCVEFRNRTWMTEDNQEETLHFLASHRLPYVCVDMPQGYPSSIPPVLAATSDLAVIRMHGHSDKWASKDIHERFGYRYSPAELEGWSHRIEQLAAGAEVTDVLFNNCYSDYAHVNAQQLSVLIGAST